jgi:hypothetical protein
MLTKRDAPTWGSTPTKDRVVVPPKDDTRGHKASEVLRSPSRVRDVLHLVHRSHSFELWGAKIRCVLREICDLQAGR